MESEYITSQKKRLARTTHLYIYEDNYAITDEDKRYTSRYDDKEPFLVLKNVNKNIQWMSSDKFKVESMNDNSVSSNFLNPKTYYFFSIKDCGIQLSNRKQSPITHHYTGRFNFRVSSYPMRYNHIHHN